MLSLDELILDTYGEYDGDPRVGGTDDFEAFKEALIRFGYTLWQNAPLMQAAAEAREEYERNS